MRPLIAILALPLAVLARPSLPSHFGSHMVLQTGLEVPLWGTAEPAEKVSVSFAGQAKSTTADASGRWQLKLAPLAVSAESRDLIVSGDKPDSSGNTAPVVLNDVLVGEVWLCSGQSNMDMTVAKTPKYGFAGVNDEASEVAAAKHPNIRMFTGDWSCKATPQENVPGAWRSCTPDTVREFSAVGYFFARALQAQLRVPVGIITLTYGASTPQAWLRRETIAADPRLLPVLQTFDKQVADYVPPTEAETAAWKAEVEKARSQGLRAPRKPKVDPVLDQHNPTVLFNGMINPVVPTALRGVLWYQGESITAPKELFPLWNETLVRDWRKLWNRELPFYFVQLAAHGKPSNSPAVREQQSELLKLPATGMAVTVDIGDKDNVHPKNKQDVGYRLALIALAKTYRKPLECSGPVLESSLVQGNTLRLVFSHTAGSLAAADGTQIKTLEIAGKDGKYLPAEVRIDGETLIVSNVSIQEPVFARYAWSNFPEGCNLVNGAKLPAAPFRTDKK